jgi:hypothetical protein
MAYLDAIGRISGVSVLNHVLIPKQGTADKWEEERNFGHMYI